MIRRFHLQRAEDVHGVSGTGRVAEGCQFENGMCAVSWLSPYATVTTYPAVDVVVKLHGHDGRTRLVWDDEPVPMTRTLDPAPAVATG